MPRIDVGLGDCIGEARSASSRRGQGARHHSQTNETKFLIVNDQVADRNVSSVGNHKRVNDLITNFCSRRVTLVVATLNQSNRRTLRQRLSIFSSVRDIIILRILRRNCCCVAENTRINVSLCQRINALDRRAIGGSRCQ